MKTLKTIKNEKLELNTDAKGLKLSVRNELKRQFMLELAEKLDAVFSNDNDIDIALTSDGVGVSIYNATIDQTITFVLDATFKNFEYDLQFEHDALMQDIQAKNEKKLAREKAKAKKIKADAIMREKKKLEKQLAQKIASGQVSTAQVEKAFE